LHQQNELQCDTMLFILQMENSSWNWKGPEKVKGCRGCRYLEKRFGHHQVPQRAHQPTDRKAVRHLAVSVNKVVAN